MTRNDSKSDDSRIPGSKFEILNRTSNPLQATRSDFEFRISNLESWNRPILNFYGLVLLIVLLTGCRQNMADQPRHEPFEESAFFADRRASRPLPAGAVARGTLNEDEHLYGGRVNGELAKTFPMEVSAAVLSRGRERYNIFCTPCHDQVGSGNGMAVRRGFRRPPPTFHSDRLRQAPPGHFYDVITNGFGAMNDYAAQIKPNDRWAIAAYIQVLQLSQNSTANDLPAADRQELERIPR